MGRRRRIITGALASSLALAGTVAVTQLVTTGGAAAGSVSANYSCTIPLLPTTTPVITVQEDTPPNSVATGSSFAVAPVMSFEIPVDVVNESLANGYDTVDFTTSTTLTINQNAGGPLVESSTGFTPNNNSMYSFTAGQPVDVTLGLNEAFWTAGAAPGQAQLSPGDISFNITASGTSPTVNENVDCTELDNPAPVIDTVSVTGGTSPSVGYPAEVAPGYNSVANSSSNLLEPPEAAWTLPISNTSNVTDANISVAFLMTQGTVDPTPASGGLVSCSAVVSSLEEDCTVSKVAADSTVDVSVYVNASGLAALSTIEGTAEVSSAFCEGPCGATVLLDPVTVVSLPAGDAIVTVPAGKQAVSSTLPPSATNPVVEKVRSPKKVTYPAPTFASTMAGAMTFTTTAPQKITQSGLPTTVGFYNCNDGTQAGDGTNGTVAGQCGYPSVLCPNGAGSCVGGPNNLVATVTGHLGGSKVNPVVVTLEFFLGNDPVGTSGGVWFEKQNTQIVHLTTPNCAQTLVASGSGFVKQWNTPCMQAQAEGGSATKHTQFYKVVLKVTDGDPISKH